MQIQNYYNQNNKILHLNSRMGLPQAAALIGTMEPSSSVPGMSDRYAQFLTAGNFKIISNLEKTLVSVR